MKRKLFTPFLSMGLLSGVLTGCALFDPDAKGFSEVFGMTWDTYQIALDEQNRPTMNYQVDAILNVKGYAVGTTKVLFNTDAFYVEFDAITTPNDERGATYNGIRLEGYAELATNAFYYHLREYDVSAAWTLRKEERTSTFIEDQMIADSLASLKDWKTAIESEMLPVLTDSSLIDYAVGLSSLKNDRYSFSFTIGGYVNWNFVKDLGIEEGISDTVLYLTHNVVNKTSVLDFRFAIGGESGSAKLTFSRPGQVGDAETTLSDEAKAIYTPKEI